MLAATTSWTGSDGILAVALTVASVVYRLRRLREHIRHFVGEPYHEG